MTCTSAYHMYVMSSFRGQGGGLPFCFFPVWCCFLYGTGVFFFFCDLLARAWLAFTYSLSATTRNAAHPCENYHRCQLGIYLVRRIYLSKGNGDITDIDWYIYHIHVSIEISQISVGISRISKISMESHIPSGRCRYRMGRSLGVAA